MTVSSFFSKSIKAFSALVLLTFVSQAYAAAVLEIKPITWNVVGLDSNSPLTDGPDTFPVGARVCNTGDEDATNVTSEFFWDSANAFLTLSGNATVSYDTLPFGAGFHDIGPTGALPAHCAEFYWNLVITRDANAFDTTRLFHIEATADGLGTVSTANDREIYIEHLVSQARNATTSITGPSTVFVGNTYQFTVTGKTATNGYEQLEFFLNFPNIVFKILSVETTYDVPVAPNNINNGMYADACGWDPDSLAGTYLSCVGPGDYPTTGKAGGNPISTTYTILVLSTGSASLTSLIYDFSGSSFHYNSDFGAQVHSVVAVEAADLDLTKTVALTADSDSSGSVTPGDTVTFTVTVTNNGPSDATNITVADQLPTGFSFVSATVSQGAYASPSWTVGDLVNGASATMDIVATVNASGDYTNIAQVSAMDQTDPDSTPANDDPTEDDQDSVTIVPGAVADLDLIKTVLSATDADGSGSITPGDTVAFTLTVSNSGPNSATNVTVADQLPTGYSLVSATPSQGSYTAPDWTVGTIADGANATLVLLATVNATGNYTNVAEVSGSDEFDPDSIPDNDVPTEDDQDSATPTVEAVADLSLGKSVVLTNDNDSSGSITVGDAVTFTVTVSNAGADDANNVEVLDQLPAGFSLVSTTESQGSYAAPTWTVGTVASGASATLDMLATVNGSGDYTNVAEVSAVDEFDPDSAPDNNVPAEDDQDSVTIVPGAVADLDLVKTVLSTVDADGSSSITPGDTVTFRLTVSNSGPDAADNVLVNDQLPSGFNFVSATASQGSYVAPTWTVGTINSGEFVFLDLETTVNASGVYSNVGEVTAADAFDPDSTPNNDTPAEDDQDDATPVVEEVADLSLLKTVSLTTDADSSGSVTVGDTVTFTITVSNSGPNSATGVTVADSLPTGFNFVAESHSQGTYAAPDWSVGGLPSGGSATLNLVATVNASGDYTNVAEVTGADQFDPDSDPNNDVPAEDDQDSATPAVAEVADLDLVKTVNLTNDADGSSSVTPGDTVTFTITVNNAGPDTATNVTVNDQLPTGFNFVSSSVSQGDYSAPTWTVGSIASAASATLDIVATVNVSGDYTNVAEINGSDQFDPDSMPDNNVPAEDDQDSASVTPGAVADLSLTKAVALTIDADSSSSVTPGDTVSFTITVSNAGPNTATSVTVSDQLPTGFSFVSASASLGSYIAPIWTVGGIASGASETLTLVATVNASGVYTNVARVSSSDQFDPDSTPGNDVPTEDDQDNATPTVVEVADLDLVKTVALTTDADGSISVTPGDTVTFSIIVSNSGPNSATNVAVVDALPTGFTLVSSSVTQGSYVAPNWSINTLVSGTSATLTIVAIVNASGDYNNIAEITASDQFDPDSTPDNNVPAEDDQDNASVTPGAVADLSLVKTVLLTGDADSSGSVTPGDKVTFTITVNNAGPNAATNVTVNDQLPSGYNFASATPSQGSYAAPTWTVGTLGSGASASLAIAATVNASGDYTNVAQVSGADQFDPDSTPGNNTPTEDDQDNATPSVVEAVDLSLTKTVVLTTDADSSGGISTGDTVTFTVTVNNAGPNVATNVTVGDQLPNGFNLLSTVPSQGSYAAPVWTVGTLGVGASATLAIAATVNATGDYDNIAQVTGVDQFDADSTPSNNVPAEDDQDNAAVTPGAVADLSLTKAVALTTDADSSSSVTPGDTVTFTIAVNNAGPNDATNVAVSDQLPDGYSFISASASQGSYAAPAWTIGDITIGGSATLNIVATVNATGNYTNVAQVSASDQFDPDSSPGNDVLAEDDQDDATPTVVTVSDLSLTKTVVLTTDTDSSGSITVGDTVSFTITVNNAGPNDANNVAVSDQLPGGYSLVSATPSQGSYAAPTWTVGTIGSGSSVNLVIAATVTATNAYDNIAQVSAADQFDPDSTPGNDVPAEDDQDNAAVTPGEVADLSLTKAVALTTDADSSSSVTPGDTVTFTITVNNAGPNDASNVAVSDQLPNGYSFVSASASQGSYAAPTWTIGDITNGGNATLDIVATVNASGDYTNVAQVSASDQFDPDSTPGNDLLPEDDQDDATPTVVAVVDLSLTKTVVLTTDADNSSSVTAGDTVTFTVTVNNAGPNNATNVAVSDQLPDGYSLVLATPSQGSYSAPIWTVGDIASGGSATLTMTATVNATGDYTNVAQVSAVDQFDPDSTPSNDVPTEDDQGTAEITPGVIIDLALSKTVNDAGPSVGDTITFTLALSNAGPNDATGVAVRDVVPTGFSGISNISNGGIATGSTVDWSGLSINNGQTVNLTFDAVVEDSGDYTNVAQVTAADQTDADSLPDNDDGDQSEDDENNVQVIPRVISLVATPICINDIPYVDYTVTPTGFTPVTDVLIEWIRSDSGIAETLVDQPFSGRLLWPGTVLDGLGNATDWPGWVLVNGEWLEEDDGLRPTMQVRATVNPQATVTVDYPPATPACSANPPSNAPTDSVPIPTLSEWLLLLLSAMLGMVAWGAFQQRRRLG